MKTAYIAMTMALFSSSTSVPAPRDDHVFGAPEFNRDGCHGSLVFFDEDNNKIATIHESVWKIGIDLSIVSKLVVEGCGCFYAKSGKRFTGRSVYVEPGVEVARHQIHFEKVKSVKKVDCNP